MNITFCPYSEIREMEIEELTVCLIIIFSGFPLYFVARIWYSVWWKPRKLERQLRQQGINGSPYKLLLGDIIHFLTQIKQASYQPVEFNHRIVSRVDPFTNSMVQKYGKVSLCWIGPTPRLIIKDPDMMKQVLMNKEGHIQKPYLNPLIFLLTRGLTTLEGEKWAKHRRIINPAFHMEKLKEMVPVMAGACGNFIERWKVLTDIAGSYEVDVWAEFQNLAVDVISRTAFGSSYEQGKKIFELQKELTNLVSEAMPMIYIPGFRYIPTKKNLRRKQLDKMITSMLTELVQKKERAIKAKESNAEDLLGLLLQSNHQNNNIAESSSDVNYSSGLTLEEVVEECKLFYLAGHETTASLLTWTAIVLAMHPIWQEKAREEALRVCRREPISYETTTHLKTVTMILHEVLRLYPPVIAQYQHAYKETNVGDIVIPAGVNITLPTLLIHHDPDIWGNDAEEFKPERFSEGVAKASKDHLAFFPFGWGPRTCIGQNFALIETKVAISTILQHFSLHLSPSYYHAPHTVMMLQPQYGAHIVLQPL